MNIGNLIEATPLEDQQFSALDTTAALIESGHIPSDKKALKMGASGVPLENGIAGEVIEKQVIRRKTVAILSKEAHSDSEGKIVVNDLDDPSRALLENEFVVSQVSPDQNRSVYIRLEGFDGQTDLYTSIKAAVDAAGIKHCTVRATIHGPLIAKMAVIKELPKHRLNNLQEVLEKLVPKELDSDPEGKFHFFGSITDAVSRKWDRWGNENMTKNPIYSTNGHYHGFSEDRKIGGHVLALKPQPGAVVELLIEPARVVQVSETA
jgi:hypothetical protein